jgi:hypothetical protein
VAIHAPPGRRIVSDHQEPDDGPGRSLEAIARNPRTKADLLVVLPKRGLDRGQLGLDLGDHQGSVGLAPAQHVDRPALAVIGVGRLYNDLVSEGVEAPRSRPTQDRVALIKKTIERSATPSNHKVDVSVQRRCDPDDSRQCDRRSPAALDVGDRLLGDARPLRQVPLAPAETMTKSPNRSSAPDRIHGRRIVCGAHRAITRSLPC